ncbi:MAG TPA: histidine kinase [Flavilitoribacter sp.]|nr:histidine kinase [Flavilitoribacter sp.]
MNWLFKTKSGKVLIHLIVWLQVMALPFIIRELFFAGTDAPKILTQPFAGTNWVLLLLFFGIMVSFFYLNAGIFVPKLLLKRRFGVYLLVIAGCMFVMILLIKGVVSLDLVTDAEFFRQRRFLGLGSAFITFWFASVGYQMTRAWFQSEQARRDLENEKLKTELSYLQGQVNPHFLFNTLNTIYTLAHRKSDRTAESVLQLSNLLRYVMDSPPQSVLLEDEIRHLQDFIALHKLRLTDKTQVVFEVTGHPSGIPIAPMLLLPFVENAFKHGVSSHRESTILFRLEIRENSLRFRSENARFNSAGVERDRTGIGIQNLQRRLVLIYPEAHQLHLTETPDQYIAELTIHLKGS